jgi:hypothetical protein
LIGKHFSTPATLQATELQKFIFSVEMLFHWSQTERERLNLTSFPHRAAPFVNKPILSIIGDLRDSSPAKGSLAEQAKPSAIFSPATMDAGPLAIRV